MTWTDAQTDRLRELHAEGYSCGYIARDIGGLTRNAVIGKIHRLGLHRPGSANTKEAKEPKRFRAEKAEPETRRKVIRNAKSLVELRERDCRFPFGEPGQPGFFFCGALTVPAYPYCAHHCNIAYTGIPGRHDRVRVR
jgi:GcrA cell cycle regulator